MGESLLSEFYDKRILYVDIYVIISGRDFLVLSNLCQLVR